MYACLVGVMRLAISGVTELSRCLQFMLMLEQACVGKCRAKELASVESYVSV